MATERALLEEILAHPDSDEPRLTLAGLLDERRDPRGEFIRVQLELARLAPDDLRRPALARRESELLWDHGDTWCQPLDALRVATRQGAGWCFHRGFVSEATLRPEGFVERGADLVAMTPLERVRLDDRNSLISVGGSQLAAVQALSRLRGLDLSRITLDAANLRALLASPHLSAGALRSLDFQSVIVEENVAAACDASRIASLESLGIAQWPPHVPDEMRDDDDAYPISPAPSANAIAHLASFVARQPRLQSLALRSLRSSSALARILDVAPGLRHLEYYDTSDYRMELETLTGHPAAARLESLVYEFRWSKDEHLVRLFAGPQLSSLRALEIDSARAGDGAVLAFAAWPQAAHLRRLRLHISRATPGALMTLLRSPHIEGGAVEELDVWGFDTEHVAAILESRIAPRLRVLKLRGLAGTGRPNAVEMIAASPALPYLHTLALLGPVDDDAARALATSPHLPRLANIILGGRPPTAEPILRPRFGPCTIVP